MTARTGGEMPAERRVRGGRRPRAGAVALLGAALGLAAAACGSTSESPGQEGPSGAVAAYFRAVERGDGARICSYLTRRARREIAALQQRPCAASVGAEARRLPESLNAYEITGQSVTADSATVSVRGEAGGGEFTLLRSGGRWRIADGPGLGL